LRERRADLSVEEIARAAHEINAGYREAIGEPAYRWRELDDERRSGVIEGVRRYLDDTNTTPEQSHENWLLRKRQGGWKYGPTESAIEKTHPCVVPYLELSVEQRAKDFIFRAVVFALMDL